MSVKLVRKVEPYLYLLPAIGLIAFVLMVPLINVLYTSFTYKSIGAKAIGIGLQNYVKVLQDHRFYFSFSRSILFTFFSVSAKLLIGLTLAILLNKPSRRYRLLRGFFFLPWCIPDFTVAILFLWFFMPSGGANIMQSQFGLQPTYWFSTRLALLSGMVANIWKGFPFFMVSIHAGLQSIPQELYEAAEVDGADSLRKFIHITLPGIRKVLLITTTLSTLWTFGLFELFYIMTRGGPGDATKVLPLLVYETGIKQYQVGIGAAMSVLTLPLVLLLVWGLVRLGREED